MDEATKALISAAQAKAELGNFRDAYEVLRPLLDREVPAALFLYSTFSVAGSESEAEFERRSLDLLRRAADLGHPAALYALGACYEVGDLVEADPQRAALLLKAAAEMGHPKATFRHGLNIYYGSNGMLRSEQAALPLIRAAAKEGVPEAEVFLKEQGLALG
jgi:TPR repeat protein